MTRWNRLLPVIAALALISSAASAQTVPAETAPDILFILDASNSMWGQIQGENKIVIARRALRELTRELPTDADVGLVAYGHRQGDCADIETVVPLGPLDSEAFSARVDALIPAGKTPITAAIEHAVELLRPRGRPATVILVSDGIETCGGDPCRAVREAKASGITLVTHVIGFGVGDVDVSQLECTAQAGDGLYIDASNARELATALDQAVAMAADDPGAKLSIEATADGELTDVTIRVRRSGSGEEVGVGRTYTSPETNPRVMSLPAGTYDVHVRSVRLKGDIDRRFDAVALVEGETVEKVVDFSAGELAVHVTSNGSLADATIRVHVAGAREAVAAGRTYESEKSNPRIIRLTAGEYDVEIAAVKISGMPTTSRTGIRIEGGKRAEISHDFASGTIQVGAMRGGALVDATVSILNLESNQSVAQGRTYARAETNPKTFVLEPGRYRITVKGVKLEGDPSEVVEVTLGTGESVKRIIEFPE